MAQVNKGGISAVAMVRLGSALVALAAFVGALALAPVSLGEGDELQIISQEVRSDFPKGIIFRVTASGPDPVEEIRVFLKPVGSDRSTYGYLDIQPATEVTGEYVMPTGTAATHKPPGTLIQYSYEVRDKAGRVLRTEDQQFLYLDETLEWKQIKDDSGLLTVYYYGDFVEKRARTVMETALATMEKMGAVLGIQPSAPIRIVAYSNYRDMSRGLPFRSQAVREDLQTEGMAFTPERVLMVLASEGNVTGVASHEFTHILVAEAAGAGYARVPAWLNEGLAEYGNIDQTPQYDWALRYAVFTRRLKPLWYLDTLGGSPDDITIGYGHGKSVVEYLASRYGEGKLAELMSAFQNSLSADEALRKTYGFDQYGLDSEWRRSRGLEPFPPPGQLEQRLGGTPAPGGETGAAPEPTPPAEAAPAAATGAGTRERPAAAEPRASRSCNAPSQESGPLDLAVLGILGGPLLALGTRWGLRASRTGGVAVMRRRARRSWKFGSPGS